MALKSTTEIDELVAYFKSQIDENGEHWVMTQIAQDYGFDISEEDEWDYIYCWDDDDEKCQVGRLCHGTPDGENGFDSFYYEEEEGSMGGICSEEEFIEIPQDEVDQMNLIFDAVTGNEIFKGVTEEPEPKPLSDAEIQERVQQIIAGIEYTD